MVHAACSISGDATDKETDARDHDVALFTLSDPDVHQKAARIDRVLWNERGWWPSSKALGNVTGGRGEALVNVTGGKALVNVTGGKALGNVTGGMALGNVTGVVVGGGGQVLGNVTGGKS